MSVAIGAPAKPQGQILSKFEYSDENAVFHGELQGISDLVTYEATDVKNLNTTFREAVDDYLKSHEARENVQPK